MKKKQVKIGQSIGTYTGTSHSWLTGKKVRVVRVLRGHVADPESAEVVVDGTLTVGPDDLLEVQCWIDRADRWSWVTSDATVGEINFENP